MKRLLPALALVIALPAPALAEMSAREKRVYNLGYESGITVNTCILYEQGMVSRDQIKYVVGRLLDYDRSELDAEERQMVYDSIVRMEAKLPKCAREFKKQWALVNRPVSPAFKTR